MMDSKQYSSFLKDSIHDKDEIRVWIGFGLTVPRCLILRFVHSRNATLHTRPKTACGRPSVGEKVDWVVSKTPLGIPKSGRMSSRKNGSRNRKHVSFGSEALTAKSNAYSKPQETKGPCSSTALVLTGSGVDSGSLVVDSGSLVSIFAQALVIDTAN